MDGLVRSCCLVDPREWSSAAKASLVGTRNVAVMYGECTSSAKGKDTSTAVHKAAKMPHWSSQKVAGRWAAASSTADKLLGRHAYLQSRLSAGPPPRS